MQENTTIIAAPKKENDGPLARHGICQNCGKQGYLRRITLQLDPNDPVGMSKDYWVCQIKRDRKGRPKGCNSSSIKEWDRNATIERQKRET